VFLKKTEMDTNDHLFGHAYKSVESCQRRKIGTPHLTNDLDGLFGKIIPASFTYEERKKLKNLGQVIGGIESIFCNI